MSRYCPFADKHMSYSFCDDCDTRICEDKWFYCLVVGPQTYSNYNELKFFLDNILQNQSNVVIISGGTSGINALIERYAVDRNHPCIVIKTDENQYRKSAEYIRNRKMHEFISKHKKRGCVAFWDGKSKETMHNLKLSKEFNTPLRVCKILVADN